MTLKLRLRHRREYPEDMTFVRMDSRRGMVMVNDGYNRLRLVDVDTMAEKVVDLAPFGDEFLIHSWTVSEDERCSLLMSSDPLDYGIGLDHTTWEPFRFELPPDLRLLSQSCWTTPRFAVMSLDGRIWNAEGGRLVERPQTPDEARRNELHADLVRRFTVFAPDCEGDGLCAAGGTAQSLALVRPPEWLPVVDTPYVGGETSAAVYRRHFVVCYSDRVEVAHGGQREVLLRPAAGREFHRLAIGKSRNGAWLAVLSGPASGSRPCTVELYELDAPPVKQKAA
jgi:hypothetical protein